MNSNQLPTNPDVWSLLWWWCGVSARSSVRVNASSRIVAGLPQRNMPFWITSSMVCGPLLMACFATIMPFIDSIDKAAALVHEINQAAEQDGARALVFCTLVNAEIEEALIGANALVIDCFQFFIAKRLAMCF